VDEKATCSVRITRGSKKVSLQHKQKRGSSIYKLTFRGRRKIILKKLQKDGQENRFWLTEEGGGVFQLNEEHNRPQGKGKGKRNKYNSRKGGNRGGEKGGVGTREMRTKSQNLGPGEPHARHQLQYCELESRIFEESLQNMEPNSRKKRINAAKNNRGTREQRRGRTNRKKKEKVAGKGTPIPTREKKGNRN